MINQNLLDLSTSILLIITMSVRVSSIYLSGALGYFLCTVLVSENSTYCTMYASIINLTTPSPGQSLCIAHLFFREELIGYHSNVPWATI